MTASMAPRTRPRLPEPPEVWTASTDRSRQRNANSSDNRSDLPSGVELICQRFNELDGVERARVRRALSVPAPGGALPQVRGFSRRRVVCFVALCCLGLIPWTIGLAVTLPRHFLVDNWPLAWIGFDTILLGCLGTTAWALWKQRQVAIVASMVTSVLLLCDAWFDVVTAHSGRCLGLSIATASFGEVPIGILLGLISIRLLCANRDTAPGSESSPSSLWQVPLRWPTRGAVEADRHCVWPVERPTYQGKSTGVFSRGRRRAMSTRPGTNQPEVDEWQQPLRKKGIQMRRDSIDGFQWVSASRLIFGEPPCTYGKGRICATEGCRTRLSRYNPTKHCSIH